MKLPGMVNALRHWLEHSQGKEIEPADLVGMLADAEWIHRENRKLSNRLRSARFRHSAAVEDIDYAHGRGLSKTVVRDLASCRWVTAHQNVIITGKTGLGKSYLACALGQKACREGFSVVYYRASRLYDELAQARADGSYRGLLRRLAKTQLLVLDDFGLELLGLAQRRDLLEVIEDRYDVSATLITSQLDTESWHAVIGDATIADAVCDRLVHNAHKLALKDAESMRSPRGRG